MADIVRPRPPAPYDLMPDVPSFTLTSTDIREGEVMDVMFTALAEDCSPHLEWSGFPAETQSFVVSCFDPDAPTPSGWWHWTIIDLPASVTSLARGVGESDLLLDGPAFHIRNDSTGIHNYSGPYPPAGDGPHRYVFAVAALDVDSLALDEDASPTMVAAQVSFHCLARATLTAVYECAGEPGALPFLRPSAPSHPTDCVS